MIAADLSRIADTILELERAGVEWLHWDVMDGVFVPNISFGAMVITPARPLTKLHFDVHLMIQHPERWIDQFVDAGADSIDVHVEGCDVRDTVMNIKERGVKAGVAFNPKTPVDAIEPFLSEVDNVIVMTVEPGFGGQKYIHSVTPKIEQVAKLRRDRGLAFEVIVDGGMSPETGTMAARAGATVLVCGASSVFVKGRSLRDNVAIMRKSAAP